MGQIGDDDHVIPVARLELDRRLPLLFGLEHQLDLLEELLLVEEASKEHADAVHEQWHLPCAHHDELSISVRDVCRKLANHSTSPHAVWEQSQIPTQVDLLVGTMLHVSATFGDTSDDAAKLFGECGEFSARIGRFAEYEEEVLGRSYDVLFIHLERLRVHDGAGGR